MRRTIGSGLVAAALVLLGCPEETVPPPTFNELPEVHAELNDGDPFDNGASINLEIRDGDGELCALTVEFSLDDGASYQPATVPQITGGTLHELACPETAEEYAMVWDTAVDLEGASATRALLRFQVEDATEPGPPQHLVIPLVTSDVVVGGGFVDRPNAQGAQWGFIRVMLANLDVSSDGVVVTEQVLDGGYSLIEEQGPPHSWEYALPTPPPEGHFVPLDDATPGGDGEAAFYLPTVYSDGDGSGSYAAGDPFVGVSAGRLVAYLRPTGNWIEEGWHVLEFDVFDPDAAIATAPIDTDVPIHLKGYPVEDGAVVLGVGVPAIDAQPHRCGLMPLVEGPSIPSSNYEMVSVPFDQVPTEVTIPVEDGWIKSTHWVEDHGWPNFADVAAHEALHLYRDLDGNEVASYQEPVTHVGIHPADGRLLSLWYLDGPMDWESLFRWSIDECWRGFNVVTLPELIDPGPPDEPYHRYECHPLDAGLTVEFVAP